MKTGIWLAVGAGALLSLSAVAQTPPEVTLTRIECGTDAKPANVAERFSDTFAYKPDLALTFTFSCYLIKHGDEYMVWDTGFAPGSNPNAPKVGIVVRLSSGKNFLLSGDAAHFHENYESNGVPAFNYDRAQTVASLERIKKIAANLKATVIIQHDLRDIGKLPAFPAAAK